jgi:hypothetical protein
MTDKHNLKRQHAYRDRMKEAGFKQFTVWAHFEDTHKVREYSNKLKDQRLNTADNVGHS